MMRAKTKPTKKEIRQTLEFYAIASDPYKAYEADKAALRARNLPQEEHDRKMKAIIERRGV